VDFEVVLNGLDEFGDGVKGSPSDRSVCDFCEEPLDEVEP